MNGIHIFSANITEIDEIRVTMAFKDKEDDLQLKIYCDNESVQTRSINKKQIDKNITYTILTREPLDLTKEYFFVAKGDYVLLKKGSVVRTKRFDELYYYGGDDLGANYSKELTIFKVWAPTATKVELLLYLDWYKENFDSHVMHLEKKGVWSYSIDKDLDGVYYKYRLLLDGEWKEAIDPYAKALTINGEKGQVIDLNRTNPENWPLQPPNLLLNETIIYEIHIRDFTIDVKSGVKNKGKYIGFIEEGTKGPGQKKTGIDYLSELGVTHIQLLPVQDFGSVDESKSEIEYNWGYDTEHYFTPEGSYATDPYNSMIRIKELKLLIQKLHERGLKVILDVVFNHVYVWQLSHFEAIVPGYYFRYLESGEIADGTGVGNDIASERLMVRKFIVDCVSYWLQEYDVDGFRFDLMGILDIETMNQIRDVVDSIRNDIILLGEGWELQTPLSPEKKATNENAKKMPRIAFFNDHFRDTVKGNTFQKDDIGFINGDMSKTNALKNLITGGVSINETMDSMFLTPMQSINYIECHDNYTLWDKITLSNPLDDIDTMKNMHRLGTAIVLLSQGIPFLHAGQEFYRTKYGVENSYNAPDGINQIDWSRVQEHSETVDYIKGLIKIRRNHKAFCFSTYEEIKYHVKWLDAPPHTIAYTMDELDGKDTCERFLVIHNALNEEIEIGLPNDGRWNVIVDNISASLNPLYQVNDGKVKVGRISTLVAYQ